MRTGAPGHHRGLHALAKRPGLQAAVLLDALRLGGAGADARQGLGPRHHWGGWPAPRALLAQQAGPGIHDECELPSCSCIRCTCFLHHGISCCMSVDIIPALPHTLTPEINL